MNCKAIVISILISLFMFSAHSQESYWDKLERVDNIQVKHRIKDTLIQGVKRTLMEYEASGTIAVDYESCLAVFMNVNNFTKIFDYTERSEQIKRLPDQSRLVYFYLDMPWPMADSDAIYRMIVSEKTEGYTQIDMISSPDLMPRNKVKRATVGHSVYHIQKINAKQIHFTATTLSVPVSEAPDWMMQAWFPNGPIKMFEKIEELSNTYSMKN